MTMQVVICTPSILEYKSSPISPKYNLFSLRHAVFSLLNTTIPTFSSLLNSRAHT
jgi:hypothetical protein